MQPLGFESEGRLGYTLKVGYIETNSGGDESERPRLRSQPLLWIRWLRTLLVNHLRIASVQLTLKYVLKGISERMDVCEFNQPFGDP